MKNSTAPPATLPARHGVSLLFWLNLVLAVLLGLLVLLAPVWPRSGASASNWLRLLDLFAGDLTLRRTALASALGLIVTAFVFFRQPAPAKAAAPKSPPRPSLPPSNVVGA